MVDRLLLGWMACFGVIFVIAAVRPEAGQTAMSLFAGCSFVVIGSYALLNPRKLRDFMQSRQPFQWARDSMDGPLVVAVMWFWGLVAILGGGGLVLRTAAKLLSG